MIFAVIALVIAIGLLSWKLYCVDSDLTELCGYVEELDDDLEEESKQIVKLALLCAKLKRKQEKERTDGK